MKEDETDISRAEMSAYWIITNISFLLSYMDRPGEKNYFLDRLSKYIEGQRKTSG